MTQKKLSSDRVILYLTACISLFLLGYVITVRTSQRHTVFIDIVRLTDGYKFKKDLEATAGKDLYAIKNITDSLKMQRKLAQGAAAAHLDTLLYRREYATQRYYEQSNQEISKKIWERLNPAVTQFGKERGYDLIIGANGTGTVLYGSTQCDMTDELVSYVNSKYEKGN